MKIITLQKAIFNEVQNQLMSRNMSLILVKFAILCQQINKDLHFNQASQYRQLNTQQIS